jgi:tetratricopeptide (TPR) repeat protein
MAALWEFRFALPRPASGGLVELSPAEVEKVLLQKLRDEKDSPVQALWELAQFYKNERRFDEATACLGNLLHLVADLEGRAACLMALGQIREQQDGFLDAVSFYKQALACEPTSEFTWYFIHNNLGFCLAALGEMTDAERYCRMAIRIAPGRPNAHKNLGIALRNQGRLEEAAQAFITSTRADASDGRASMLLDKLLEEHPELTGQFAEEARFCKEAVKTAELEHKKRTPAIHRGWRKRLFLWRFRVRSLLRRLFHIRPA